MAVSENTQTKSYNPVDHICFLVYIGHLERLGLLLFNRLALLGATRAWGARVAGKLYCLSSAKNDRLVTPYITGEYAYLMAGSISVRLFALGKPQV